MTIATSITMQRQGRLRLLTGDDAEHAPAFLNAIRDATATAARTAAEGAAFQRFTGSGQPSPTNTVFDQLLSSLASRYAQWQERPLAGQPVFDPENNAAPELLATQREMLVLLKLQRRMITSGTVSGSNEVAADRSELRTKVTTFNRAREPK